MANMISYQLTFGHNIQIPEIRLDIGEAYSLIERLTSSAYVIPFAMTEIEPNRVWSYLKQSLSYTQNDEKYLLFTSKD